MTLPVLVDCDTGIDDAFALSYLACRPEVHVTGIVSSAGNVDVHAVHRNNLALAELLRTDAPVSSGAEGPLIQELMTAADTHGPGGLGHAALPPSGAIEDPRSGAQRWVAAARHQPGEVAGRVVGRRTNRGLVLATAAELPPLLKRVRIIGGPLSARRNTGPTNEWNIAGD